MSSPHLHTVWEQNKLSQHSLLSTYSDILSLYVPSWSMGLYRYVFTSPTHSLGAEHAFTTLSTVTIHIYPIALCPLLGQWGCTGMFSPYLHTVWEQNMLSQHFLLSPYTYILSHYAPFLVNGAVQVYSHLTYTQSGSRTCFHNTFYCHHTHISYRFMPPSWSMGLYRYILTSPTHRLGAEQAFTTLSIVNIPFLVNGALQVCMQQFISRCFITRLVC